jgi:zinc protease
LIALLRVDVSRQVYIFFPRYFAKELRMTRLLKIVSALFLTTAAAQAGEVSTFSLENGMDVVVIEDNRAPVVVSMVWYKVGAADEPPGKSGIAHFLEHLMFKRTATLDEGEFSRTVRLNGGSDNAFTSQDYTAYFQRVSPDRLGLMMKMEADRMRNLEMTVEDVETERKVVLEERNQRTESDPGALFSEQRNAAQYLNHPYAIPTIGWKQEVQALTREDAFDFYQRYYAPNNAILVVAGDVSADEVRALAGQYFGPVAPTPGLKERTRPQEPPQTSERRMRYSDPRVSQPYIVRSYLAPERDPGEQNTAAALTLLADLLGGSGTTSVLGRALQFDTQTAVYTSAFYTGLSYDDRNFGFVVLPTPGVSLDEAEQALDDTLADFLDNGIDADQFARLKRSIGASMIYAQDSLQGQAQRYGAGLTSGLTVADIEAWPDILSATTEAEVMQAARDLLDKRRSVTGWLMSETIPDATTGSNSDQETAQ